MALRFYVNQCHLPPTERVVEESLEACEFGVFQVKLYFILQLCAVAYASVNADTAYLLPNADVFLNMTLADKGMLNASPFLGMIISSPVAGYAVDTFGRRKILLLGYGLLTVIKFFTAFTQRYWVAMVLFSIQGFIFCALHAAITVYLSEISRKRIRDKMVLVIAMNATLAQIVIAFQAWAIMPLRFHINYLGLEFLSFHLYLIVMSIWCLIATIGFYILPESPAFLLARRQYLDAERVLKNIYVTNTKNHPSSFPVNFDILIRADQSVLKNEEQTSKDKLKMGLKGFRRLFCKPHFTILVEIGILFFFVMLVYNTLRLWYPQILSIVKYYDGYGSFPEIIDKYYSELGKVDNFIRTSSKQTYIYLFTSNFVYLLGHLACFFVVNRLGKWLLILLLLFIILIVILALWFLTHLWNIAMCCAIAVSAAQSGNALINACVNELFPTEMKSQAVTFSMGVGRLGTFVGNLMFPVLIAKSGFAALSFLNITILCGILTMFLTRNQIKKRESFISLSVLTEQEAVKQSNFLLSQLDKIPRGASLTTTESSLSITKPKRKSKGKSKNIKLEQDPITGRHDDDMSTGSIGTANTSIHRKSDSQRPVNETPRSNSSSASSESR